MKSNQLNRKEIIHFMERKGKVTNLGDTSFREGNYIQPTKIILKLLREYIDSPTRWSNTSLQNLIYNSFILQMNDILHRHIDRKEAYKLTSKKGMRGRGIANAMTKIGLADTHKQVSKVACDWLDNKVTNPDTLEKSLPIKLDNLVFLRQFFKLRIYGKTNHIIFIRPFIFMLRFFIEYPHASLKNLGKILDAINPDVIPSQPNYINNLINDYKTVKNTKTFNIYFTNHFQINNKKLTAAKDILNKLPVQSYEELSPSSQSEFNYVFANRKSNTSKVTNGSIYFNFVNLLVKYRIARQEKDQFKLHYIIKQLIFDGKNNKIKKAFGHNKVVFQVYKNDSDLKFLNNYSQSIYLRGKRINIYYAFLRSKSADIRREYADMMARIFSLSSVVNRNNNSIKANLLPIWKEILNTSNFQIVGNQPYSEYDLNPQSDLYQDLSLQQILGINDIQVSDIIKHINVVYGLPINAPSSELINKLHSIEETKFEQIINQRFPRSLLIKLLEKIIKRCNTKTTTKREKIDSHIQKYFSSETTVPTIFEYLLGISWYYLSNKHINLLSSFNLEMDGNFLPLTQAPGGEGDIEIKYSPHFTLLLEATLMDRQAQKRGELEPVIRHSANLKSDLKSKDVHNHTQTIYVADKLDYNVDNIFRSSLYTELNNSAIDKHEKPVNGVNIFPLTINELIKFLKINENNPQYNDYYIINTINHTLNNPHMITKNIWRTNSMKYFNL